MSEQPDTPEPTEQEASDAFYNSIYGQPEAQALTAEDEDLYSHYFPNN